MMIIIKPYFVKFTFTFPICGFYVVSTINYFLKYVLYVFTIVLIENNFIKQNILHRTRLALCYLWCFKALLYLVFIINLFFLTSCSKKVVTFANFINLKSYITKEKIIFLNDKCYVWSANSVIIFDNLT